MIIWGKLIGFLVGVFSGLGLYGAIVGLILGHLVDMYLKQRSLKSQAAGFFEDPKSVELSDREHLLITASGLSAAVSGLGPDKGDYARELIGSILRKELSLSGGETDQVRDYIGKYLAKPPENPDSIAEACAKRGYGNETNNALVSALLRVEERTGVTAEKTRLIKVLASHMNIPEKEFISLRRTFLGFSLEHYEILGLPPEAPTEEIKKTFRNLAVSFHPDGAAGLSREQQQESEKAFITIQKAYEAVMKERGEE